MRDATRPGAAARRASTWSARRWPGRCPSGSVSASWCSRSRPAARGCSSSGSRCWPATLGSRAVDGLAPARPAAYAGVATLVSDPEDRLGATVADVRVDGQRATSSGPAAPAGARSARGWPASGCGSRAGSAGRPPGAAWLEVAPPRRPARRRGRCGSTVRAARRWRAANRAAAPADRRRQLAVARARGRSSPASCSATTATSRPTLADDFRGVGPHPPARGVRARTSPSCWPWPGRCSAGCRSCRGGPSPSACSRSSRSSPASSRRSCAPPRWRRSPPPPFVAGRPAPALRHLALAVARSGAGRPAAGAVGRLPALGRGVGRHPRDRAGAAAQPARARRCWSSRSRSPPARSSAVAPVLVATFGGVPGGVDPGQPARRPGGRARHGVGLTGGSRPAWRAAPSRALLHLPTACSSGGSPGGRAGPRPRRWASSAAAPRRVGLAAAVGVLAARPPRPAGPARRWPPSCSSIAAAPVARRSRDPPSRTARGHAGRRRCGGPVGARCWCSTGRRSAERLLEGLRRAGVRRVDLAVLLGDGPAVAGRSAWSSTDGRCGPRGRPRARRGRAPRSSADAVRRQVGSLVVTAAPVEGGLEVRVVVGGRGPAGRPDRDGPVRAAGSVRACCSSSGDRRFDITHRALVMGILNRTPDSFYDQGSYFDFDGFLQQGRAARGRRRRPPRRRRREGRPRPRGRRGGGARPGRPGHRGAARPLRRAALGRHVAGVGGRAPRSTAGAVVGNDISGFADPDYLPVAATARRVGGGHPHPARAPRARPRAALRRPGRRGRRVPASTAPSGPRRPASRASGSWSTPASTSARPSRSRSSCCAPPTGSRRSATRCSCRRRTSGSSGTCSAPRSTDRHEATPRRARARHRARAAASCGPTTCAAPGGSADVMAAVLRGRDGDRRRPAHRASCVQGRRRPGRCCERRRVRARWSTQLRRRRRPLAAWSTSSPERRLTTLDLGRSSTPRRPPPFLTDRRVVVGRDARRGSATPRRWRRCSRYLDDPLADHRRSCSCGSRAPRPEPARGAAAEAQRRRSRPPARETIDHEPPARQARRRGSTSTSRRRGVKLDARRRAAASPSSSARTPAASSGCSSVLVGVYGPGADARRRRRRAVPRRGRRRAAVGAHRRHRPGRHRRRRSTGCTA